MHYLKLYVYKNNLVTEIDRPTNRILFYKRYRHRCIVMRYLYSFYHRHLSFSDGKVNVKVMRKIYA